MASNSGTGKEDPKINPKLPTWDGTHWGSWADYKLQVELEIDSTSTDDLERLGPKLGEILPARPGRPSPTSIAKS